ncbi:DHA2 family methylenomycin A resistance protein-like MFS transporter [Streptomyces sp. SAI-126]|uniref:MFS transporter n=1 Tax=unclassified Streptomyces TaxID=2593676 RepID=UPI0024746251|nr:MFS transporter [Streptomyces sp. SAI-119]MDH6455552.1 DHA2 family methylenomycin A resistance protein-like MFS transporter [Streptomyces sp. SAI-119]
MTTARTGEARAAAGPTTLQRGAPSGLKITALATGFVMATLDVTVVNVAGATIQEDLGTSLTQLTWIVDGYVLTFASLLMLAGGLANRIGAKTIYLWGMAVFFLASLACALSPTPEALIAARLVQGAGAALFMPSSLSLLVFSFPEKRQRTRMLGLWSAIVATSSGLGPTVGGLMVSAFGWQSIFLLNLPIGAVGMVMTYRYIAAVDSRATKLAVPGHVIWIVALAAVSFALIEGPQLGWTAGPVLAAYAVMVAAATLLTVRERRADNLVMPWQLFRGPGFSGANLVGFLFNFALFGSTFMLGLYFQHARGATPFQAGLELLPMTIFFPVANIVYSQISARFSNGVLLTVFLLIAGVASLTMITVSPSTPYWVLAIAVGVANIGAGIISPGMTAALVDSAGPENANVAGSVLNANRQIGSLVGIAVMSLILNSTSDWNHGAAVSFLAVGIAYLLGSLSAWRLISRPERRATVTAAA